SSGGTVASSAGRGPAPGAPPQISNEPRKLAPALPTVEWRRAPTPTAPTAARRAHRPPPRGGPLTSRGSLRLLCRRWSGGWLPRPLPRLCDAVAEQQVPSVRKDDLPLDIGRGHRRVGAAAVGA